MLRNAHTKRLTSMTEMRGLCEHHRTMEFFAGGSAVVPKPHASKLRGRRARSCRARALTSNSPRILKSMHGQGLDLAPEGKVFAPGGGALRWLRQLLQACADLTTKWKRLEIGKPRERVRQEPDLHVYFNYYNIHAQPVCKQTASSFTRSSYTNSQLCLRTCNSRKSAEL